MTEPTPELATSLSVTDAGRLLEAEAFVRSSCGWHIAPSRSEDIVLNGSGSPVLFLPTLWLTAIVGVVEDGVPVDLDTIEWSRAGELSKRTGRWTSRSRGVVVSVVHGHDPVPADVAGLVRSIARKIPTATDGRQVKQRTTGPFSESFGDVVDLLPSEAATLTRYRIPRSR